MDDSDTKIIEDTSIGALIRTTRKVPIAVCDSYEVYDLDLHCTGEPPLNLAMGLDFEKCRTYENGFLTALWVVAGKPKRGVWT